MRRNRDWGSPMTDLETRVGLAMHARSDQLAAPDDLVLLVLARARTVRLRRRVAVGAVAVATAGVVAVDDRAGEPDRDRPAAGGHADRRDSDGRPHGAAGCSPPSRPRRSTRPPSWPPGWQACRRVTCRSCRTRPRPSWSTGRSGSRCRWRRTRIGDPRGVLGRCPDRHGEPDRAWLIEARGPSGDGGAPTRVGRLDQAGGHSSSSCSARPAGLMACVAPDGSMLATHRLPVPARRADPTERDAEGAEIAVLELGRDEQPGRLGRVRHRGRRTRRSLMRAVRCVWPSPTAPASQIAAASGNVLDPASDLAMLIGADGCRRVVVLAAPDDARRNVLRRQRPRSHLTDVGGSARIGRTSSRTGSRGRCSTWQTVTMAQLPIPEP